MAATIDWRILIVAVIIIIAIFKYQDRKAANAKPDLEKVANDVDPPDQNRE